MARPTSAGMLQTRGVGPMLDALSHCQSSPKYTFKGRETQRRKPDTPGPGAYVEHTDNKYNASPKFGFAGAARDGNRASGHPGPGSYSLLSARGPETKFGKSDRSSPHLAGAPAPPSPRGKDPGPGAYPHQDRIGNDGPKYCMGAKHESNGGPQSPGPGAYREVDASASKLNRQPAHGFGSSTRKPQKDAKMPGPGAYIAGKTGPQAPEWGFSGYCGRKDSPRGNEPGPGSYQLSPRLGEGPKFSSIGSRSAERVPHPTLPKKPLAPGPGAYAASVDSLHKYNATPRYGFGSSPRDQNRSSTDPGPGSYNEGSYSARNAAKYGFGSQPRAKTTGKETAAAAEPGPGAYALSARLGTEGPCYSARGRTDKDRPDNHPGPGSYDALAAKTGPLNSPRYGFGTGIRKENKRPSHPGPGRYYNTKLDQGVEYSFGKKYDRSPDTGTPGPGSHEHGTLFGA